MSILKAEELAGWIKKAGESQRVSEFQYPFATGLYVNVSYASKFLISQIREASKEMFMNPRTRQQEERLNDEKLRTEYARTILKGWRGLTLETLKILVPGVDVIIERDLADRGEEVTEAKTEIPFDSSLAKVIMQNSMDFENWVIDIATNSANYTKIAEVKKDQYENL